MEETKKRQRALFFFPRALSLSLERKKNEEMNFTGLALAPSFSPFLFQFFVSFFATSFVTIHFLSRVREREGYSSELKREAIQRREGKGRASERESSRPSLLLHLSKTAEGAEEEEAPPPAAGRTAAAAAAAAAAAGEQEERFELEVEEEEQQQLRRPRRPRKRKKKKRASRRRRPPPGT